MRHSTLTTTEIKLDSRQKLKVLASLEAQTMVEWLEWVINKAYDTKIRESFKKKK